MDSLETEIKLKVVDALKAHEQLLADGFIIHKPRIFEANTLYDTPTQELRGRGVMLRLRQAGDTATITFKGPKSISRHKSREEHETIVSDISIAAKILSGLGYAPAFRYQKFRTEYYRAGERGLALLDETPIGWYIELEGEPSWIDAVAERLGYAQSAYITESYFALYQSTCELQKRNPSDMIFT